MIIFSDKNGVWRSHGNGLRKEELTLAQGLMPVRTLDSHPPRTVSWGYQVNGL